MRHAIYMTMFNRTDEQLELSKLALESVFVQDIGPLDIYIINNGSTDPTFQWLQGDVRDMETRDRIFYIVHHSVNRSPLAHANKYAPIIFDKHDYLLGVPNDVILPPNAYRLMSEWPRGFVTASGTTERNFARFDHATAVNECTPMAVMLTRKWAYDALVARDGYFFDEHFWLYASDCDLALRMASCGIRGIQLDLQYYHYGSAHWRMLPSVEGAKETDRANRDREYFRQKWGFAVDAYEYGACAGDINFRGGK